MVKIAVNARFLTQPLTGVQRYAAEVSRSLKQLDPDIRFFGPRSVLHQNLAEELGANLSGKGSGHYWEQFSLPRLLKQLKNPLLLNLCNTAPLNYTRTAVVIHDLAFMKHPEWFSRSFAGWYGWMMPKVAAGSIHIFTVSQFSCREITGTWPAVAGKISVAGNGVADFFRKPDNSAPKREPELLLAISGNNNRKNPGNIIESLKYHQSENLRLVMTGRAHRNFGQTVTKNDLRIECLPDLSDASLKELYQKATALVYPSQYEGFGLPPLEALACGCPSVLTDIPALREVYDGCAHFIPDGSPWNIMAGIREVMEKPEYAKSLVEKGADLLERHTFKKVAEHILSALNGH